MKEHYVNQLDNFIAGWYSPNLELCDMLVAYHKGCKDKIPGSTIDEQGNTIVDTSIKDSIDLILQIDDGMIDVYAEGIFGHCCELYQEKYPWCNEYSPWACIEPVRIQYYMPGGGYHRWHTERSAAGIIPSSRHLAFMTYLNDVDDGGETEFFHQKIKIKPEKGLTLIWPVDWTFTHRGIPSMTSEKYIITGWLNYIDTTSLSKEALAIFKKEIDSAVEKRV